MRWPALILALLLLPLAAGMQVYTLKGMGIMPAVSVPKRCRTWELPYALENGCTPVFLMDLKSGEVNVLDNNVLVFHAKKPGKYRVLLNNRGVLTIVLCVDETGRGEIDANSFLTCAKMPLADVNVERKYFRMGYDSFILTVCNKGTEELNGVLSIRSPPFMAPLTNETVVQVPPKACKEINVPVVVSFTHPLVNMPPQCVTYRDPFGEYRVCTPVYPTKPVGRGFAICLESAQIIEIFNPMPFSIEAEETEIEPFSAISMPRSSKSLPNVCSTVFHIERKAYTPKRSPKDAVLAGLILMGFAGIWARWESVKKG